MKLVVVIGAVFAGLLLFARKTSAMSTINRDTMPRTTTAKIERFALAIATAEGYGIPGAIPTRANNPGDLMLGGSTLGEGITHFADESAGWNALYHQLERIRDDKSSVYSKHFSILEMAKHWAPFDAESWAHNVAQSLSVPVSTEIGILLS